MIGNRIVIGKGCLIADEVIIFDAPVHPAAAPLEAMKPVTVTEVEQLPDEDLQTGILLALLPRISRGT